MRIRQYKILCALLWLIAQSADAKEEPIADALPSADTSPVVIDGVALFSVVGAPSLPSEQRAHDIRERIVRVARDPNASLNNIAVVRRDERFDVLADGRHLVSVIESDATFEGAPAAIVAQLRADRIRNAVLQYRAERTPQQIGRAALIALLATAGAILAVLLTLQVISRLSRWLEHRFHARVQSVKISSFEVVRAENIWRTATGVVGAVRFLAIAGITYAYIAFTLQQFPWTRGFGDRLLRFVLEPLATIGAALLQYLPKLLFLIVLVAIVRYLLKLTSVFSRAIATGRVPLRGFDAEWALPTYNIVRVLIVLLAVVIAYPYLPGSGSAAFQGLSIFAGLMLSLGASSAMASVIAGYTVTYRRAFRVGDRITIGEFTGEVTDVRLLVTHLRTPKNEEVVVPNSVVLQSHVINYSKLAKSHGLIMHTTVGIGYETPWRQVEEILMSAAGRTSGVLTNPAPFVLVTSLGDFAVTYELNAYVDGIQGLIQKYTKMNQNILDAFNEHGVQIMTPAYESDPEQPKLVPKELWYAAPARRDEGSVAGAVRLEHQNMTETNAMAPP